MKKLLLIVLCLLNFVFLFEYLIIRDDTVFMSLGSKKALAPVPVIDVMLTDDDFDTLTEKLVNASSITNTSFKVGQFHPDRMGSSFIVYGKFFNEMSQNVSAIDFTSLNEKRYMSTTLYDDNAVLIEHFNKLPMARSITGKSVRYAYTIEPISYFDLENSNGDEMGFPFSIWVEDGNAEEFAKQLGISGLNVVGVEESLWDKPNLHHNLDNVYLVMTLITIVGFSFIYNESQGQRRFVNGILGISKIEMYFKIYLMPLFMITLSSLFPLSIYLLSRYSSSSILLKDSHKILFDMVPILLGSSLVATGLVYIENMLNKNRKSMSLFISALLKSMLILMIVPTFTLSLTQSISIKKEVSYYDRLISRFGNSFTLSNEIYLNTSELAPVSNEQLIDLRKQLDDLGAIYFDANIHTEYQKALLNQPFTLEMQWDHYNKYSEETAPVYLETIYVNDNYLLQEGLIDHQYPDVSLIIVPTEHMESVSESIKTFPACQDIPCKIIEKNITIDNISLQILSKIDRFKNPILFSGARGLDPLIVSSNGYPGNTASESQVAGVFYLSTIISNEHLADVEKMIEGIGESYTISIDERFGELVSAQKERLIELLLRIALYACLIGFLIVQSIKNFQSVYSKDIAVKIMMGCSYFESIKDLLISNIVVYGMIVWMLLSGGVPMLLGVKQEEMINMNAPLAVMVMAAIVIFELGLQSLYGWQFKKQLSDKLKGEQDE